MDLRTKPFAQVMDEFIALAILRFIDRVETLSALNLLDYGCDNWPQPHSWTGMKPLRWQDLPTEAQKIELLDRLRKYSAQTNESLPNP